MILFCGIPSEAPLALAIEAAEAAGAPHVVLSQRALAHCDLTLQARAGAVSGCLTIGDAEYDLSAFTGVYVRLMEQASLPEARPRRSCPPDPLAVERLALFHRTLIEWLEVAPARVVNRASAMLSNFSKPYQAQLIARQGLPIPPTLVTNDAAAVRAFASAHEHLIFKSISSIRSIVRELDTGAQRDLERLRNLPTQFQERIVGADVRVHVVGDELFACAIESDAVDYRYAARDQLEIAMTPCTLPDDVARACLRLSAELDLPFCGIDLKRTADGRYVCFEVNPSPAYSFYEECTGQSISAALVSYLGGRTSERSESACRSSRTGPR